MPGVPAIVGFGDAPRDRAREAWVRGTVEAQREAVARGDRLRPPEDPADLAAAFEDLVPETDRYFAFHRQPLRHQLRDFYRFRDARRFALFYEQRARKTKVVLDVFRHRVELDEVDALVVVAFPNGVHRVWLDELPKDLPSGFLARTRTLAWSSARVDTVVGRRAALDLRGHDGPVVLTMNCEAMNTKRGYDYLDWFLARRRVVLVADESSWAANWSARTRKLLNLAGTLRVDSRPRPNVVAKAILDGTPVEEGPLELYYPTTFLERGLLGYGDATSFRSRYCEFEEEEVDGVVRRVTKERRDPRSGKIVLTYEVFKGYRNLDELWDKLTPFSARVLRRDVADAPEKTYQSRAFELTKVQRRAYDDLRERYVAELSSGKSVRAADVLLRMIRLQMVARNYWPPERVATECATCAGKGILIDGSDCGDCGGLGANVEETELERIDPDRNPAAEALVEEARTARGPIVVWCVFQRDVADAVAALESAGLSAFRYDGTVPADAREDAYQRFRSGEGDAIVGTITSGLSRGKDLTRARLLVYYSNHFGLRWRRQSEDRAEGLDREVSTDIVDLIAVDTRDVEVVDALREKRSIAARIMRDPPTKWL